MASIFIAGVMLLNIDSSVQSYFVNMIHPFTNPLGGNGKPSPCGKIDSMTYSLKSLLRGLPPCLDLTALIFSLAYLELKLETASHLLLRA